MSALDAVRRYHPELTAIRRDIHAHPELGLEEHRTADIVARKLDEWGIEVHRGVGGTGAVVSGDSANDLLGVTLDPNVHIQESKVASCDIVPGRRPQGASLTALVQAYQERAGITELTGNQRRTPGAGRGHADERRSTDEHRGDDGQESR